MKTRCVSDTRRGWTSFSVSKQRQARQLSSFRVFLDHLDDCWQSDSTKLNEDFLSFHFNRWTTSTISRSPQSFASLLLPRSDQWLEDSIEWQRQKIFSHQWMWTDVVVSKRENDWSNLLVQRIFESSEVKWRRQRLTTSSIVSLVPEIHWPSKRLSRDSSWSPFEFACEEIDEIDLHNLVNDSISCSFSNARDLEEEEEEEEKLSELQVTVFFRSLRISVHFKELLLNNEEQLQWDRSFYLNGSKETRSVAVDSNNEQRFNDHLNLIIQRKRGDQSGTSHWTTNPSGGNISTDWRACSPTEFSSRTWRKKLCYCCLSSESMKSINTNKWTIGWRERFSVDLSRSTRSSPVSRQLFLSSTYQCQCQCQVLPTWFWMSFSHLTRWSEWWTKWKRRSFVRSLLVRSNIWQGKGLSRSMRKLPMQRTIVILRRVSVNLWRDFD